MLSSMWFNRILDPWFWGPLYCVFMNEAHYQWHSITAGRFILVHTTKPLYSWKKGSAKPVHSVPIWILKRCYEYFILIVFFSYTLTLILRIYIHWKTIWMYQKYHNNNNSKSFYVWHFWHIIMISQATLWKNI